METKFYLTWSYEKPKHPKHSYKQTWYTGVQWGQQINKPDQSFNDWKNEKIKKYKKLLNHIVNPTEKQLNQIIANSNFIKWCEQ